MIDAYAAKPELGNKQGNRNRDEEPPTGPPQAAVYREGQSVKACPSLTIRDVVQVFCRSKPFFDRIRMVCYVLPCTCPSGQSDGSNSA